MIRDIELIKTEMSRVEEKVNRSRGLIVSLADERRRWEDSKSMFNTQLSTLGGDTLVCAAFLAYAGYFDHKGRRTLLAEWRAVLEAVGIRINPESTLVCCLCSENEPHCPVLFSSLVLVSCGCLTFDGFGWRL